MKSILLSIKPEWVAKILNGEKTIEIRKQFPKDYVGWVYIYCTQGTSKTQLIDNRNINNKFELCWCLKQDREQLKKCIVNGKIVARFWCDKVEDIDFVDVWNWEYRTETLCEEDLLDDSCLTREELDKYLNEKWGYAIHISKLEVFDRPRELFEFNFYENGGHLCKDCLFVKQGNECDTYHCNSLTKAPQNYCYIEGEEK